MTSTRKDKSFGVMTRLHYSFLLVSVLAASIPSSVLAEIKTFNGPLPATSRYVQYSSGYLVDPGYIDLTDVKFIANENEPSLIPQDRYVDDDVPLDADDFVTDKGTSSPTASPTAKATTKATADKGTQVT
jgi:hypothetical protein